MTILLTLGVLFNVRYVDGWMHSRFRRFLSCRNGRIDDGEDRLGLFGPLLFIRDPDFFFGHVEIGDVCTGGVAR
jgi:hypothetical protein